VALQERSATDLIRKLREQHVARGVSMPSLVVERARGGLPLASVTGRAEVVDAAGPGGLGATFGGNPVVAAAREGGLILLTCGLDGNVGRIVVPFAVSDPQLEHGLAILEGALGG